MSPIIQSNQKQGNNSPRVRSTLPARMLPVILVGMFIFLALAADLTPAKKYYFNTQRTVVETFSRLEDLDFRSPLPFCGVCSYHESLPYMVLLKTVHSFIPDRLFSLRLVSVFSGAAGLVIFYLIGKSLLSRPAALVAVYFLATNAAYLETARSYGYLSLSYAIALLTVLFGVWGCLKEHWQPWVILSAVSGYLLLYLYAPMRITAIPLVVAGYFISGEERWRKILIFGVVFAVLLFGFSLWQRSENGLISSIFQGDRWEEYGGTAIVRNLQPLTGYLFNLGRTTFATDTEGSRLYHSVYLPFWIIGLLVCLLRRRRGHIILLLLMGLIALTRLPTHRLTPRRIVDILYPLALLTGLGMTAAVEYLSRLCTRKRIYQAVLAAGYLFLAGAGLIEVRHFFRDLSRPPHPVTTDELARLADSVLDKVNRYRLIFFPYEDLPYVHGNRYLVNRLTPDRKSIWIPTGYLQGMMEGVTHTNQSFMVVYHRPMPEGFSRAVTWAREHFPESISVYDVPDSSFGLIGFIAPDSISPNLIASLRPRVLISGGKMPEFHSFVVAEEPVYDVEMLTAEAGEPPWIIFDFGEDNRKIPRVLVASPPRDQISARPDLFIREAVISAGSDGENWEELGRLRGDRVTRRPFVAYQWTFPGDRPWRYYRLTFFEQDGRPARSAGLYNLGLYESERHPPAVFHGERLADGGY